jgi:hypothetical protein
MGYVPIGNAGNADDAATGSVYGAVAYTEAHLILWKVGQASSLFLLT